MFLFNLILHPDDLLIQVGQMLHLRFFHGKKTFCALLEPAVDHDYSEGQYSQKDQQGVNQEALCSGLINALERPGLDKFLDDGSDRGLFHGGGQKTPGIFKIPGVFVF